MQVIFVGILLLLVFLNVKQLKVLYSTRQDNFPQIAAYDLFTDKLVINRPKTEHNRLFIDNKTKAYQYAKKFNFSQSVKTENIFTYDVTNSGDFHKPERDLPMVDGVAALTVFTGEDKVISDLSNSDVTLDRISIDKKKEALKEAYSGGNMKQTSIDLDVSLNDKSNTHVVDRYEYATYTDTQHETSTDVEIENVTTTVAGTLYEISTDKPIHYETTKDTGTRNESTKYIHTKYEATGQVDTKYETNIITDAEYETSTDTDAK